MRYKMELAYNYNGRPIFSGCDIGAVKFYNHGVVQAVTGISP